MSVPLLRSTVPCALVQSPDGWLALESPRDVLIARTPAEVAGCVSAAESAARRGAYAAGFLTYEAAAAFGLAAHDPLDTSLPLAWFGVFTAARIAPCAGPRASGPALAWTPSIAREEYLAAIARIKTHIADGDTYQLNFTFRLRSPFEGDPRALFDRLVAAQRGA